MMAGNRSDAIDFLKSSIAHYSEQLETMQAQLSAGAGSLAERMQLRLEQEHVVELLRDAARLLAQLGGG